MLEIIRNEREPILMLHPANTVQPDPLHASVMVARRGSKSSRRTKVEVPMSSHTMWAIPLNQVLATQQGEHVAGVMVEIDQALRGPRKDTRQRLTQIHERVGLALRDVLSDPELRAQLREGAGYPPYRFEPGTSFIIANGGYTPYATVHTWAGKALRTNYFLHTPADVTIIAGDIAARVLAALLEQGQVPDLATGSVEALITELQRKRGDPNAILDLLVRDRVSELLARGFRDGWGEQERPQSTEERGV